MPKFIFAFRSGVFSSVEISGHTHEELAVAMRVLFSEIPVAANLSTSPSVSSPDTAAAVVEASHASEAADADVSAPISVANSPPSINGPENKRFSGALHQNGRFTSPTGISQSERVLKALQQLGGMATAAQIAAELERMDAEAFSGTRPIVDIVRQTLSRKRELVQRTEDKKYVLNASEEQNIQSTIVHSPKPIRVSDFAEAALRELGGRATLLEVHKTALRIEGYNVKYRRDSRTIRKAMLRDHRFHHFTDGSFGLIELSGTEEGHRSHIQDLDLWPPTLPVPAILLPEPEISEGKRTVDYLIRALRDCNGVGNVATLCDLMQRSGWKIVASTQEKACYTLKMLAKRYPQALYCEGENIMLHQDLRDGDTSNLRAIAYSRQRPKGNHSTGANPASLTCQALQWIGHPAHLNTIYEAVSRLEGFVPDGDWRKTIRQTLYRNADFIKVDEGVYALADWLQTGRNREKSDLSVEEVIELLNYIPPISKQA